MTVVVNQCLGFADYEVRDMTILNVRLYQSYVFVLICILFLPFSTLNVCLYSCVFFVLDTDFTLST